MLASNHPAFRVLGQAEGRMDEILGGLSIGQSAAAPNETMRGLAVVVVVLVLVRLLSLKSISPTRVARSHKFNQ